MTTLMERVSNPQTVMMGSNVQTAQKNNYLKSQRTKETSLKEWMQMK